MYETFYKLSNDPFRLLPDPAVCFPHRSSSRAWAYLRYALKRGEGVVVVTGPPGSGKTTLAERLLGELNPSKIISVRLVANDLSPADLLRKLAYALGLPVEGKDRAMLTLLIEKHLIEVERSQRRVLVVIDEAQTLSHNALEAMRLLTDMQSQSRPILQLFLFGQEELEGVMSAPGMEQFQHRVIASCRLQPMNISETKGYLEYRLTACDWRGDPSVNGPAVMAIYRYSHGVPRHVNKICSRLLLHGSSEEQHALNERDVKLVVNDLRSELLAPLSGGDEPAEQVSVGVFDSVYELALVPSLPRHEEASKKSGGQRLHTLRLDDDAAAGATSRSHARPEQSPSTRRRGTVRVERYMLQTGRRRGPQLGRRVLRRIGGVAGHARNGVERAWEERGKLLDNASLIASKTVARAVDAVGTGRRWFAGKRPQLEALGARPFWGMPAGRLAGAVAAISLVTLTGVIQSDNAPQIAEQASPGNAQALSLGDDVLISANVLEGNIAALGPGAAEAESGIAGRDGLNGLLAGNFLAENSADGGALSSLLGDGLALPQLASATGGGGIEQRGGDSRQPLLGSISGDTSSQLVRAVTRHGSSLNVWALARHPDAVSSDGNTVWALANKRGEQSLRVASRGIDKTNTDMTESEPLVDSRPAAIAVDAVQTGANEDTASPAVAGLSATQPDETSASPIEAEAIDETVQATEIDIVASTDGDASLDFSRILPATSAGDSGEAVQAAPDMQDVVVAQLPERLDVAMIDEPIDTLAVADQLSASVAVDTQAPTAIPEAVGDTFSAEQLAAEQQLAEQQREIDALIAKADKAIAANRLLLPEKRSAYRYLKQVKAMDSQNAAAEDRLNRIVSRYAELAKTAIGNEAFDRADRFVGRALRVDPSDTRLKRLRDEVAVARAEAEAVAMAEAELARLAAEPIPEPVAPPPPKNEPSGFQRLMSVLDGL